MDKQTIMSLRYWAGSHVTAVAAACVFAAVLGLYLLTQHTLHVVGALPYALILLCPLMHFLMPGMHGGHGAHGGQTGHGVAGSDGGHENHIGQNGDQNDVAQHGQEHD